MLCADVGIPDTGRLVYSVWQLCVLFVIPAIVLMFCYIRVIWILWMSTQQLQTMTSPYRLVLISLLRTFNLLKLKLALGIRARFDHMIPIDHMPVIWMIWLITCALDPWILKDPFRNHKKY